MKKLIAACAAVLVSVSAFAVGNYFDGFEDNPWSTSTPGWNNGLGSVGQVASGVNGITAKTGNYYGLLGEIPNNTGAAFSRLGGYSSTFDNGFVTRLSVFMDLSNTAITSGNAGTFGFDISSAASDASGSHRRDFIFHVANDAAGNVWAAGSNNTNFAPRGDLASLGNNFKFTSSGWYTLEWNFRDFGDGSLAVDLNLLDGMGSVLFTETRHDASDVIGTTVGGNRYMWLTALQGGDLAIDDSQLQSVPEPCTLLIFGGGALAAWRRKRKSA